jgi:hypothetical protein
MMRSKKDKIKKSSSKLESRLTLLFSLIGAIASFIYFWEYWKPAEIKIKALEFYEYVKLDNSMDSSNNPHHDYDSKNYLIKVSVSSSKDFDFKEIKCEGYDSLNNRIAINLRTWESLYYYDSKGTGDAQISLTVQQNEYINSLISLKQNDNYVGFVGLASPVSLRTLQKVKLTFFSNNNHATTTVMKTEEIISAKKQDPLFY